MSSTASATENQANSAALSIESLPSNVEPSIVPLSLPPQGSFNTFDNLFAHTQQHAKEALYAFIIGHSEKRKGRIIRVLNCQREGCKKAAFFRPGVNSQHRKKERNTTKTGCLFSIKAKERADGSWDLLYREDPKYSAHNHPPAESSSAFPAHRQLAPIYLDVVAAHQLARVPPKSTVVALRQLDPSLKVIPRDIYNINAELSRAKRRGKSPTEALIAQLEAQQAEGKVIFAIEKDDQHHINFLFIAATKSVEYLNKNAEVVLLDCTYKTNKFGMPLLHIIAIDGMNQTFTVAICFLDQENEDCYNRAVLQFRQLFDQYVYPSVLATDCDLALISALERYFPAIRTKVVLCFWHILKNVAFHCKAKFETQERWELFVKGFRDVVHAKTEGEYKDILQEWKDDFHWNNGHPYVGVPSSTPQEIQELAEFDLEREALAYCIGQWLTTHKSKVVHAWVDRYFHAEARTTSALEGRHHTLKSWIGTSTGDLTTVWESTQLAIEVELIKIQQKRAKERQSTPIHLSSSFYYRVTSNITNFGLKLLSEQYAIYQQKKQLPANDPHTICTGNFSSAFGVPCWHTIKLKIEYNQVIQPLDFHPHYHYLRPSPGAEPIVFPTPILDPISYQRRRSAEAEKRAHARQHNRLRTAQTGRILSQFEEIIQPLRHCSACIAYGHDKATCRGCQSTGHTRSTCPNQPSAPSTNRDLPVYEPSSSLQPAYDSFYISQYRRNHIQTEGNLLQEEERVPATQYAIDSQSQIARFF